MHPYRHSTVLGWFLAWGEDNPGYQFHFFLEPLKGKSWNCAYPKVLCIICKKAFGRHYAKTEQTLCKTIFGLLKPFTSMFLNK